MKRVKTAVIGSRLVDNVFLKTLTDVFHVTEIAAIVEDDPAIAQKIAEAYSCEAMTMNELCADRDIEFAVNLSEVSKRYDTVKRLLLAGKHVYTEKPLCTDFEKGRELVELAENCGLKLSVGPDIFLGAGLQTARKVVDSGWIGRPTSCVAALNRNHVGNSETFGFVRERDGSFPYDMGVYYLSALIALLGPVSSVYGMTSNPGTHEGQSVYNGNYGESWETPGSNLSVAVLTFSSGVLGTLLLDGTSINDESPLFVIYGTEGILTLDQPDSFSCKVKLTRANSGTVEVPFTHDYDGSFPYSEPGLYSIFGNRGIGAAECAWSVLKDRAPRGDGTMGLHMLEIIHGIEQSNGSGTVYQMTTTCHQPRALPSGYFSKQLGGFVRMDGEYALTL